VRLAKMSTQRKQIAEALALVKKMRKGRPEQIEDMNLEIDYKTACVRLGFTDPEVLDYVNMNEDDVIRDDEAVVFKLDGMSPHDVAIRISEAVRRLGPYAAVDVDDEQVIVRKERVRICSDDD
jgi:hypothetical protein